MSKKPSSGSEEPTTETTESTEHGMLKCDHVSGPSY